ncbi:MAG: DNA adenine methylase [Bacteroidetes bacterium]|nr:MAG: DNA adenine methylase [Bacteroidota bacterium]
MIAVLADNAVKALLTYYGGKQKLVPTILPLIPPHSLYCEPFAGGAAILFAKEPSKIEVINDTNGELINFYRVVKDEFPKLQKQIARTLHSRALHYKARFIYSQPHLFDPIERAWAIFTMAHQSYSSILDSTWSCGVKDATSEKKFQSKKAAFTKDYAKRLERVQMECRNALEVITTRDSKDAFFYVDPPYFNSDCGHYEGYSANDFEKLLKLLSTIKGTFLLSSYPSDLLRKYSQTHKWHTKVIETNLSVQGAKKNGRRKTEVLTANYPLNEVSHEK